MPGPRGVPDPRRRDARLAPGDGYVAPPLDGVWATAPYLHNGSVPTLAALLDSRLRQPRFGIGRGDDDYDLGLVGWRSSDPDQPGVAPAWIWDTARPRAAAGASIGAGNGGGVRLVT